MSLFSRLDRVRDKAKVEADSEGVFAAPDLGSRPSPGEPAPIPAPISGQNPASAGEAAPLMMPLTPHDLAPQPKLDTEGKGAESVTDEAAAPPAEVPETVEPKLDSSAKTASQADSPATATPVSSAAAVSRSPFDRLMAERDVVARDVAERDVAERDVVAPEPTVDDRFVAAGLTPTRDAMSSAVPAATAPVEIPFMADSLPPDAADAAEELPDFLRGAPSSSATASPVASATETPTEPSRALERANLERASLERPMIERPITERPFGDRFAGRAALDREVQLADPLARAGESAAGASSEASRAPLVRIENEAAQSEREGKNRAAYRRKHLIFDSVLGSIDPRLLQSPTRDAVRPAIEKGVDGALREFNLTVESADRNWLVEEFLRETTDFGPLVSLLDDPGVNKILVTGSSDVAIEKLGRMERTGISFRDDDHLLSIIRRLAEVVGGRIDAKVPLLDRPLPDGARVRAKIPPMAPQPTLTLEKSSGNPFVVLKRQQIERGRGDNLPYAQLRERIQQRLVREFEGDSLGAGNQEKLRSQVEEMINAVILEERVMVTRAERAALVMDLLNEIVGLGPIEPLLNDPEVDEVMVNGPYQIYIERKGKLELSTQRFRDNAHVLQVIERIVAPLGRRVDEKTPMVDGRLRDGSRFNAIIPPLALSGPTMTIRKFARDPFTMTDLINFGTLTRESAQFLQAAVEGRLNIVVSGGTGSGKTTTLNVLSSFIPSTERIVTIEDAAELQLRQEHVIRLETRPPNIEGIGEVGIRELVRNSLRMRPDRIVVGECRGGEALDMLQAMNTGHDGSLTTGHSNGPRDMLKRLETMVMMAGFDLPVKAIREQISMAVHVIVHQERMRDGKRRITAVSELVGMEGDVITMQDIFRFEQERVDDEGRIIGALVPTGLRPKNFDTILDNGVELSMELFHPRVAESSSRSRFEGRMNGR